MERKHRCPNCHRYYSRQKCEFCLREKKWNKLIFDTKIKIFPLRIVKLIKNSDFLKDQLLSKKNWYFFGKVGTGKTLRSASVVLRRMKEDYIRGKLTTIGYYNVPELLLRLRDTFSKDSEETEKQIFMELSDVNYLILDDLGVEKVSEWALQTLYIIINHRYENLAQTIITSNYSFEQLKTHLGSERLVSRISEMCFSVEMKGTELRK